MKYREAKRLHNEDEVILKKTGKPYTVIAARNYPDDKLVELEISNAHDYQTVSHKEVK